MNPKLIVEQKITAFANKYAIYAATADGEKGELLALAQQKRLAFKEKVTFYSDEAKTTEVFSFRAEKVMDVHGRYFVEDAAGNRIGAFKKEFAKSLLNSTWDILDNDDKPVFVIKESNEVLAVLRRFLAYIPIVGGIAELVLLFFRYHFIFVQPDTGAILGTYKKTTLIRDHYQLAMSDELFATQDWRVVAAMAVALDALQSR